MEQTMAEPVEIISRENLTLDQMSLAPFPPEAHSLLWDWMHEFPKANFDDTRPADLDAFLTRLYAGALNGDKLIGVMLGDAWVGAIGIGMKSDRTAQFKGICFTRSVHGTGIAKLAVQGVISALWTDSNILKIDAAYFADNRRIRHFLKKLGAVDEGYRKAGAWRDGKPLDVREVAFFRPWEAEVQ